MSENAIVIVTPEYNAETGETTMTIRGLKKGAHVVISVPGVEGDHDMFIGQGGRLHAYGFGGKSDAGPVRISG